MHRAQPSVGHTAEQWQPDIDAARRSHFRRHDAEHGIKLIVQVDGTAENGRVAVKSPLPQGVADDRQALAARLIFVLRKNASDLRLEADDFEKRGGDDKTGEALRPAIFDAAEIE